MTVQQNVTSSFAPASNPKASLLDTLRDTFVEYKGEITTGSATGQAAIYKIKEIKYLIDCVNDAAGSLSSGEQTKFIAITQQAKRLQASIGVSDAVLDNTELPFEYSTGRKTARPVFPRRFDA